MIIDLSAEGTTQSEFVTLTVVVRRSEGGGDPCEQALTSHGDVLFVGHQDGVTSVALSLGAEPSSWS